jgi:hypothetical protein
MQENIQDCLVLEEADSGFQLVTKEYNAAVVLFISTTYITTFSTYLISKIFFYFRAIPGFINLDY